MEKCKQMLKLTIKNLVKNLFRILKEFQKKAELLLQFVNLCEEKLNERVVSLVMKEYSLGDN